MSKGFQRVNPAIRPTDTIHDQFKVTPVYTVQAAGEFAPYARASLHNGCENQKIGWVILVNYGVVRFA